MSVWDAKDDQPTTALLQQAGWADGTFEQRCSTLYASLSDEETGGVSVSALQALLVRLGVQADAVPHIHRAMCRRGDSVLDRDSFVLGLCAMDPLVAHAGVWNGLRAQYIFRRYDADADGHGKL